MSCDCLALHDMDVSDQLIGFTPEEIRTNEDQLRISLEYERKAKSGAVAVEEFESGEIYHRAPAGDPDGGL